MSSDKEVEKKEPMNDIAKLVLVDQMVKEIQGGLNDTHRNAEVSRLGQMIKAEMAHRKGYEQRAKRMQTFYDGITPQWENETKEAVVKRLIDAGELFGKCRQQAILIKSLVDQLSTELGGVGVGTQVVGLQTYIDSLVEMMAPPEKEAENGGK